MLLSRNEKSPSRGEVWLIKLIFCSICHFIKSFMFKACTTEVLALLCGVARFVCSKLGLRWASAGGKPSNPDLRRWRAAVRKARVASCDGVQRGITNAKNEIMVSLDVSIYDVSSSYKNHNIRKVKKKSISS